MSALRANRSEAKNMHAHQRNEAHKTQKRKREYARILNTSVLRERMNTTDLKSYVEWIGTRAPREKERHLKRLEAGKSPHLSKEDQGFLDRFSPDGSRRDSEMNVNKNAEVVVK